MFKRKNLPSSQLYDSRYTPVETYNQNKSLENLHLQIRKIKEAEKKRFKDAEKARRKSLDLYQGKCNRYFNIFWKYTFGGFSEDWVFLGLLGILVAIISYILDKGVTTCMSAKLWLYSELSQSPSFGNWVAWICLPVCLILWDVGFTYLVAPQAAGSGLPQIKTILRGVYIKEVLTWKCLLAKWVGITATIGSGMPLGKEGPLIHMSSVIVTKMGQMIRSFHRIAENKSKAMEMLGAAWAVGVACTFNAPIGGVLFSVEISTAYYAVRNYWRGFFAAVWGATTYRLLSVWIDGAETITVVFKTSFFVDFPYDPQELFAFAILGVICGIGGSIYIWSKKTFNSWVNNNKNIKRIKKLNRFLYPGAIVLIISSITYPPGIGQFIASTTGPKVQVEDLFSNFTWTNMNHTVRQHEIISRWTTKHTTVYTNLVCFFFYQVVCSIMASSMPIPNGSFIPVFRAGAVVGRITGELMHLWFPLGVRYRGKITQIMPGAYAMVGAAAFSGAVTHTMSVCVILFEMTSQITHVIPVLIAVLIANGIAKTLTPSIYDLVIISNKLPYLPDLLPNKSAIYNVYVEDFMISDIKYLFLGMTYKELKQTLKENKEIGNFPLVDDTVNMILLGSIPRMSLVMLIEKHIGQGRKLETVPQKVTFDNDIKTDEQERLEMLKRRRRHSLQLQGEDKEDSLVNAEVGRRLSKKVTLPLKRIVDLPLHEQMAWEITQMDMEADFTKCHVDPAPFQLVEKTSLLKVHSMFSMLALKVAYVTSIGRLVGVVGLIELRKAIEDVNTGKLPRTESLEDDNSIPLLPKG